MQILSMRRQRGRQLSNKPMQMQGVLRRSARAVPEDVDRQQGEKISEWSGHELQLHQVRVLDLQSAIPALRDQGQLQHRNDHHRKAGKALLDAGRNQREKIKQIIEVSARDFPLGRELHQNGERAPVRNQAPGHLRVPNALIDKIRERVVPDKRPHF